MHFPQQFLFLLAKNFVPFPFSQELRFLFHGGSEINQARTAGSLPTPPPFCPRLHLQCSALPTKEGVSVHATMWDLLIHPRMEYQLLSSTQSLLHSSPNSFLHHHFLPLYWLISIHVPTFQNISHLKNRNIWSHITLQLTSIFLFAFTAVLNLTAQQRSAQLPAASVTCFLHKALWSDWFFLFCLPLLCQILCLFPISEYWCASELSPRATLPVTFIPGVITSHSFP